MENNPIIQENQLKNLAKQISEDRLERTAQQNLTIFFKNNSYFKEYYMIAAASFLMSIFFGILSGTSSYNYVFGYVSNYTAYPTPAAWLFILSLHLLQQYAGIKFFTNLMRHEFKIILFVMLIFIYSISTYTAYFGAKSTTLLNAQIEKIDIKSELKDLDEQINATQKSINRSESFLAVQDDWATRHRDIPNLRVTLKSLNSKRDQKEKDLNSKNVLIETKHFENLNTVNSENSKLSVFSDLFVLLLNLYQAYFMYKCAVDYDLINEAAKETDSKNTTTLPFLGSSVGKKMKTSLPIGFKNYPESDPETDISQVTTDEKANFSDLPREEIQARVKLHKKALQQWEWKERNNKGKTETNQRHIVQHTKAIQQLESIN
jgi:cell division protein FtsB